MLRAWLGIHSDFLWLATNVTSSGALIGFLEFAVRPSTRWTLHFPRCTPSPYRPLKLPCAFAYYLFSVFLGFDSSSAVCCPLIKVVIADQRLGLGYWCVCKLLRNSASKYRWMVGGKGTTVVRWGWFHAVIASTARLPQFPMRPKLQVNLANNMQRKRFRSDIFL